MPYSNSGTSWIGPKVEAVAVREWMLEPVQSVVFARPVGFAEEVGAAKAETLEDRTLADFVTEVAAVPVQSTECWLVPAVNCANLFVLCLCSIYRAGQQMPLPGRVPNLKVPTCLKRLP